MQREGVVLDTLFSSLPFPFILNLSLSDFLCFRVIPPVLRYQMAKYEVSPISLSYSRCHVPGGLWLRVSPTGETRRKREREGGRKSTATLFCAGNVSLALTALRETRDTLTRGWVSGSWMKSLLEGRLWGAWPSVPIPSAVPGPTEKRRRETITWPRGLSTCFHLWTYIEVYRCIGTSSDFDRSFLVVWRVVADKGSLRGLIGKVVKRWLEGDWSGDG